MLSEKKTDTGSMDHFVICDMQECYSEKLLKILMEKIRTNIQFYIYHDLEKLKEFSKKMEIHILLIGEEYLPGEREGITAAKKYLLTGDRECTGEKGEIPLFRYQSVEKMTEIIFNGESEQTNQEVKTYGRITNGGKRKEKNKTNIHVREVHETSGLIGVYSPIHRVGKTKFAMRLGKKLAQKHPVLYLNLEGYSGENHYFQDDTGSDLGDLLYFMKQEDINTGFKINMTAGQMEGMDYILPMKNENDLRMVTPEEWMELLDTIQEQCIYEHVILDLGDCVNGLYEILRRCSKVYTPYIEDGISAAKLAQYERSLRDSGYGEILSRTVRRCMKRAVHQRERMAGNL